MVFFLVGLDENINMVFVVVCLVKIVNIVCWLFVVRWKKLFYVRMLLNVVFKWIVCILV